MDNVGGLKLMKTKYTNNDDYIYCPEMKDIILRSQALCLVCGKCDELPTLYNSNELEEFWRNKENE